MVEFSENPESCMDSEGFHWTSTQILNIVSKDLCDFSRLRENELEIGIERKSSSYTSLYRKNRIFYVFNSKYDFSTGILGP